MIEYALFTDRGERDYNEDSVATATNLPTMTYGFFLADGLGGHGHGDIASKLVTDFFCAAIENTDEVDFDFIRYCFDNAQEVLLNEQEDKECIGGMKSTMVSLYITNNTARWGYIGDSRLYLYRQNRCVYHTLDHSVPQMMVFNGEIEEKDIRHHPDRNRLLYAFGGKWLDPPYELQYLDGGIEPGDIFILCSDGFWEWIEEKEITKILKKENNIQDALKAMQKTVLENGKGHHLDNVSAIIVKYS